jgi:hypothetical protein
MNTVQPGRPQMTIWHMRIACWITKATNTHSRYVILIACPLQPASLLRYTYSTLPCLNCLCCPSSYSHTYCTVRHHTATHIVLSVIIQPHILYCPSSYSHTYCTVRHHTATQSRLPPPTARNPTATVCSLQSAAVRCNHSVPHAPSSYANAVQHLTRRALRDRSQTLDALFCCLP